ncbi:MAG: glycerol-3-phosphate 1-O-acyltransferase PlsY [Puniceicoccales bacterium]|jgi:glycerol-3-phosphate acyltransferase PlsY|nr:glycerol-3-phosphate 1-O-acyltransferase PlsY [Puniceicoccales bacterium]
MFYFAIFFAGYFLGAIPFGFIVAKINGINILQEGSGSLGATNVKRVIGNKWGTLVFILDCLKGFVPVSIVKFFCQTGLNQANNMGATLLIGLVLGHCYSIFLKFCGGKGVATAIGGLAVLMPSVLLLGIIFWCSVFSITRFVSLASLCFALSLPINAYLFAYQKEMILFALALTILIFIRHSQNIRRLWKGEELRAHKVKE